MEFSYCNALLLCLGAVGSATPALRCLTACGQWAVQLLQCTASLPGGSGQWNFCNALPHCIGAVSCCVVLCRVVSCRVVSCHVVSCLCCVVLCCVVLCCVVPKALLPEGKGRDVYPRVQVNGRGCVCGVRAVCKCVDSGGERGSREDLVVTPLATVLTPGAPAVPLLSPLAGAGVTPAMPTPFCCPGPGGPSATWHTPWREHTRPVWTPR